MRSACSSSINILSFVLEGGLISVRKAIFALVLATVSLYRHQHDLSAAPGYDFYMFKGMAWTLKLALLIYLYGIVCIFTKNYFPKLCSLCTEEVRAVITGYKSSWSRGKQLCPVFTYKVGDKEYSEALNEAKGTKEKSGDVLERGFTLRLLRKIIYNPQNPKEFYLPGCEYYSRKAAVFRYILFSMLLFLQLYLNFFVNVR